DLWIQPCASWPPSVLGCNLCPPPPAAPSCAELLPEAEEVFILLSIEQALSLGLARPALPGGAGHPPAQRSRRASRSDSSRVRTSPSRTGPFTLRMMERLVSGGPAARPGPLTCVHCPWEPVRPSTLVTCGQRARRQPAASALLREVRESPNGLGWKGPYRPPGSNPRHGQGRLPLNLVAQSPIQPDLEHFNWWGTHSLGTGGT
uniref:Uncharacterized protein n=1 Tax=Anser brachyrhynchus TaxID=132585 RepID=A0A8B9BLU4_9AVES